MTHKKAAELRKAWNDARYESQEDEITNEAFDALSVAESRIAELELACEFKDKTNAALQARIVGEATLRESNRALAEALRQASDWADRIAGDERVCGWVHREDYGLYCLLADCPVDFDAALDAAKKQEGV